MQRRNRAECDELSHLRFRDLNPAHKSSQNVRVGEQPSVIQCQMKPTSKREEEIVGSVDQKARAIRDGVGAWGDRIAAEMKIAVGFQMSLTEEQFLESQLHGGAR